MGNPILTVENLSVSFGTVKALDGIDFSIGKGEILCLAGENGCGKSTFVKVVSGVYKATSGTVTIDGQRVENLGPVAAINSGVQVIYQDLSLFDHLTVAENIAINRMLHDGSKLVNKKKMLEIAAEQLARVGISLPLDVRVSTLSMANRQLVAIARALSMDARILFLDEPTTALTTKEVQRLLSIVLELKTRGLSVVFISHKLDEVFEIADTITIFREGVKVGDFAASDLDQASLSYHMTGRHVAYNQYRRAPASNEPILEVENLTKNGNYNDVSFSVRKGDIVGLTGLLGAGRTEIALSLFGLNTPDSGKIQLKGSTANIRSPWEAMDHGIALVPEDRKSQGLFGSQTIAANASSTMLDKLVDKFGLLNKKAEQALARSTVHEMGVNNKNIDALVKNLSGGNAQKVVIGKWIATNPSLLILDSPTVGIDVGSKAEIYDQIHKLADEGVGVIFISDEPEEIIANCNRVIVMHEGDVLDQFDETEVTDADFKEQLARIVSDPTYQRQGPVGIAPSLPAGGN